MANSNISVRVNGRPASNSGHIPLVSINSPQFQLEDKEYVGFNDNSYFFTVKIVENYVIYKLVKIMFVVTMQFVLQRFILHFQFLRDFNLQMKIHLMMC